VALSYDFEIETTDPVLNEYLGSLFSAFLQEGSGRDRFTFVDHGDRRTERYELQYNGEQVTSGASAGYLIDNLIWQINSRVIKESDRYLLVHAAAAESNGRAVVLPAPSGSGKTTLVTGLINAGFRYLTDEATALDPESGLIAPYPKPLGLKGGSWEVLADLEPDPPFPTTDWLVDPCRIRDDALAPSAVPACIVSPIYRPGTESRLIPLRPAETVMTLVENCFNLRAHGRNGLALLAAVAREAPGYRLEMGDLQTACALIDELMARPADHEGQTVH
jgi:hypothetical protein